MVNISTNINNMYNLSPHTIEHKKDMYANCKISYFENSRVSKYQGLIILKASIGCRLGPIKLWAPS